MKEKRKQKNNLLVFFIFLAVIMLLANIYMFFNIKDVLEIKEIGSSIIVSDSIGFDLNSSSLTFGKVTRGGSSNRILKFENNYDFPVYVEIYGKGEINKFVKQSRYFVEARGKKEIHVNAYVPEDIEFGRYKGKVIVVIKKDI